MIDGGTSEVAGISPKTYVFLCFQMCQQVAKMILFHNSIFDGDVARIHRYPFLAFAVLICLAAIVTDCMSVEFQTRLQWLPSIIRMSEEPIPWGNDGT
jgi:uncharacterized membrane protein